MLDAGLVSQGLHVLRYPAANVLAHLDDVVRQIVSIALERRGRFER